MIFLDASKLEDGRVAYIFGRQPTTLKKPASVAAMMEQVLLYDAADTGQAAEVVLVSSAREQRKTVKIEGEQVKGRGVRKVVESACAEAPALETMQIDYPSKQWDCVIRIDFSLAPEEGRFCQLILPDVPQNGMPAVLSFLEYIAERAIVQMTVEETWNVATQCHQYELGYGPILDEEAYQAKMRELFGLDQPQKVNQTQYPFSFSMKNNLRDVDDVSLSLALEIEKAGVVSSLKLAADGRLTISMKSQGDIACADIVDKYHRANAYLRCVKEEEPNRKVRLFEGIRRAGVRYVLCTEANKRIADGKDFWCAEAELCPRKVAAYLHYLRSHGKLESALQDRFAYRKEKGLLGTSYIDGNGSWFATELPEDLMPNVRRPTGKVNPGYAIPILPSSRQTPPAGRVFLLSSRIELPKGFGERNDIERLQAQDISSFTLDYVLDKDRQKFIPAFTSIANVEKGYQDVRRRDYVICTRGEVDEVLRKNPHGYKGVVLDPFGEGG